MSESDYRFSQGHKRKREAEPPEAQKKSKPEPELTSQEMDDIALLIAATVRKYTPTIAENAEEGARQLSQQEFEYHLFLNQGGDLDEPDYEDQPSQTPELHQSGDDFYPGAARTTTFMSGSPLDDDDVVMDSYPEEIISPQEGLIEGHRHAYSPFETVQDQHAGTFATTTGEKFSDEFGEEFSEEFDEDYIDQAATEIAGEALSELLDEVINELSSDVAGDPPDPEVLRWLIRGHASIAESLEGAREQTVNLLKEKISELSRDTSMVER